MSGARGVVVGARRTRQGIGPFVARALQEAGAEIVAVVGTTPHSAAAAALELDPGDGRRPAAHTELPRALDESRPDFVALCSPFAVHAEQLRVVAEAGLDCLCEKPLWWPAAGESLEVERIVERTEALVEAFRRRGRRLSLVTQWPQTLASYAALYPGSLEQPRRFRMHMGPITQGAAMVLDGLPHPISMLQAVAGPGRWEDLETHFEGPGHCRLRFHHVHARGRIEAEVLFRSCPEPPRPAGYSFDDGPVERRIALPDYVQSFETPDGRRVVVPDPVPGLVADFLREDPPASASPELVVQGMRQLAQAWHSAVAAEARLR